MQVVILKLHRLILLPMVVTAIYLLLMIGHQVLGGQPTDHHSKHYIQLMLHRITQVPEQ